MQNKLERKRGWRVIRDLLSPGSHTTTTGSKEANVFTLSLNESLAGGTACLVKISIHHP